MRQKNEFAAELAELMAELERALDTFAQMGRFPWPNPDRERYRYGCKFLVLRGPGIFDLISHN